MIRCLRNDHEAQQGTVSSTKMTITCSVQPKVENGRLAFLLCIREVPGSDIRPYTVNFLPPSRRTPGQHYKLSQNGLLPYSFQFIHQGIILQHIHWATDSVIIQNKQLNNTFTLRPRSKTVPGNKHQAMEMHGKWRFSSTLSWPLY
jgi:hypothetical protein